MWKNFKASSTDEEVIVNGFCTNPLFKISSDDLVRIEINFYISTFIYTLIVSFKTGH